MCMCAGACRHMFHTYVHTATSVHINITIYTCIYIHTCTHAHLRSTGTCIDSKLSEVPGKEIT